MEIEYKLHPRQHDVFRDESRFVLVAAGRRFGKTRLAVVKIIVAACEIKGAKIWYIAPQYNQAKDIAWQMMLDLIPKELIEKKNEVELSLILRNGSKISLKGANNPDTLRGVGLNFCVLDEYGDMKVNVWQEIVRPMLTDTLGTALFIGTPKGKNHFWELWLKGQRKENGYSSYQFKTADNPYIQRSEIKEAAEQLSDRYFRQEYEASFEDYTGLIWPEFDESVHVVEPFEIPNWYHTVGVIDPAISGTTGCLYSAIDDDGNPIIFGEYYERDKRVSEVCEVISGRCSDWYGDPAGRAKLYSKNGVMFSLFDEYAEYGIHPISAQKDVNAGINRVAEYFKGRKIKILNTCKNLIWEIQRYHWTEERETMLGVSVSKPYKANDHLCDCLRYLIMSRQEGSSPEPAKIKRFSEAHFEQMEEQQSEYDEVA